MEAKIWICGFVLLLARPSIQKGAHVGPEGSFRVFEDEKIRAARGENISAVVTHADVPRGARFEFRDGRIASYSYESLGNGSFKFYSESRFVGIVATPIRFVSQTRKLKIHPSGFGTGNSLTIQYLVGTFNDGCPIWELDVESDDERTCQPPLHPLAPLATSCVIRKACQGPRHQKSTSMVCERGNWLGDVKCKLDPSIVQRRCEILYDDPTAPSLPSNCPYNLDEVVKHIIEEEEDPDSSGRAKVSRRACRRWCNVGCPRRGKGPFVHCIICKFRVCVRGNTSFDV